VLDLPRLLQSGTVIYCLPLNSQSEGIVLCP